MLSYKESEEGGGLLGLMEQVADIASWCIGAGVKHLSVYERTGQLLDAHEATYSVIQRTLVSYYGSQKLPTVRLSTPRFRTAYPGPLQGEPELEISFICEKDGRQFLVELTQDYANKAIRGEMDPSEVTVDRIGKDVVGASSVFVYDSFS